MKKLYYLLISVALLSSCATFKLSDLKPNQKNPALLPALEPKIDVHSFESVYSAGYSSGTSTNYETAVTEDSYVGISVFNKTSFNKDPRVQDAITIFDRDVKDNITNPIGEKKGYILCKIAGGEAKYGGYGWAVLSGITLMIPNLFGMPVGYEKTLLDVEVEIYDLNNNLLGRYNAQCKHKTYIALYHGYSSCGPKSSSHAERKSSSDAFKCAMNDIKNQIAQDFDRLNRELNK